VKTVGGIALPAPEDGSAMPDVAHRFDDSAAYERFMGAWSRAAGAVFLEWLAPPQNARWLDIGCGTGVFTRLILDTSSSAEVFAVDSEPAQIDHARRELAGTRASFRIADGCALPFSESTFDIVASALVINFIPDRPRAIAEMRRVAKPGGVIASYVWDFAAECSPSWPLRRALQENGFEVPPIPGARDSSLHRLRSLFEQAGLESIATRSIEVAVPFGDFDTFWQAQTPSYSPTTKLVAAMMATERARLIEAVRAVLPTDPSGQIQYVARANAIKATTPN
jgi:ubiquinone/menaquinone biosynthesis C-methylase UbiE